jgi:S1-C subfamily serine protease
MGLKAPVLGMFATSSLTNKRLYAIYRAITNDDVKTKDQPLWQAFRAHVERRNEVVHSGRKVSEAEAKASVEVAERIGGEPLLPLHGRSSLRAERPRDGEAIAVSGYPLGEPVLVTNTGVVASSWSVALDEVPHPSLPGVTSPELRDVYLADVQTNPGNSGGPVYSAADGSIIGVLVAGRLTNVLAGGEPVLADELPVVADAGLSIVVPIKYAVEMLNKHGVSWSVTSAATQ